MFQYQVPKTFLRRAGPYLKAFFIPTGELLASSLALEFWRIHKIVSAKNIEKTYKDGQDLSNIITEEKRLLAIYGSKTIHLIEAIIKYDAEKVIRPKCTFNIISKLPPLRDWIHDVRWLYDDSNTSIIQEISSHQSTSNLSTKKINNSSELAVAFAHNFVEIWDVQQLCCVYSIQCEDLCILCSARFFGNTRDSLILASGTAFNQVILWKITQKNEKGRGVVFKRLIGHEGSVFGVRFNDDGKVIASVSDDRTIRVWKITDDNPKPLILYGHMARVWDCLILNDHLISISEDSTCRVWHNRISRNMNDDDISDVDCLACWEGHVGKNIWSLAINPSKTIVATGGGDSGIRLWSLSSVTNNKIDSEKDLVKITLPSVDTYIQLNESSQIPLPSREHVRNFVLVDYCTIVIATNFGCLLKHNYITNEWTSLNNSTNLQNYTMMKASKCGRIVCCGSIDGNIYVISVNKEFKTIKKKLHEFKVFEIFFEESSDPDIIYVISHAVHNDIYILKLELNCKINNVPKFEIYHKLLVPQNFLLMSLAFCPPHNLLVCGSRESGLIIFNMTHNTIDRKLDKSTIELSPVIYLKDTHRKQAVTSVALKFNSSESNNGDDLLNIYTSGRDGGYVKYRLRCLPTSGIYNNSEDGSKIIESCHNGDYLLEKSVDDESLSINTNLDLISGYDLILEEIYRAKITKGWIEKVMFVDDELILLGFYKKRFFVYNDTKKFEMLSIACGGAHRVWHFKAQDKRMNKASFMFIRKENVFIYSRETTISNDGFNEYKLQENFHGKECRNVRFLSYSPKVPHNYRLFKSDPIIFATGAEDSLLRLFQYIPDEKENRLFSLCSIKKHSSVIKNIEWSFGNELLLFSCGASEELTCWKVEIDVSHNQKKTSTQTPFVNINCLEWASCPVVSEILETRIMDTSVCSISTNNEYHIIAAVYSDSILRVWLFDEEKRSFFLIGMSKFHNKCILQIENVVIKAKESMTEDGILLFTSATDGRIAVWDISHYIHSYLVSYTTELKFQHHTPYNLGTPIFSYQAHQSGVNCLALHQMTNLTTSNFIKESYMVVTGGEDNAIAAIILEFTYHEFKGPNSGIRIINGSTILSTSIDQRLNLWNITFKNLINNDEISEQSEESKFELIKSEFVNVCDPCCMDVLRINDGNDKNDKLMIATSGIGIELFQINL
ncbi:9494_t:CDS:10 [Gigaspora margarita]|uniref:9494_t:CDS:1 n=1 Tax=Gigaspora margarita TaxID=4874 RepID=A0ABN7UD40_GIGMA|nr:9494_t:CDS:10 [Gigaspora margarita]